MRVNLDQVPPAHKSIPASVQFENVQISDQDTFLDYILGGTKLEISVAIDFSQGNLDRSDAKSLHRGDSGVENQYLCALERCLSALQPYNIRKTVATYGFGSQVFRQEADCQRFALSMNIFEPEL